MAATEGRGYFRDHPLSEGSLRKEDCMSHVRVPNFIGHLKDGGKLTLPEDAVTQVNGILGKRGKGKSNLLAVMLETFAVRGQSFCSPRPACCALGNPLPDRSSWESHYPCHRYHLVVVSPSGIH
jgi:hypothetical protein